MTIPSLRSRVVVPLLALGLASPSDALFIRRYRPALHDWRTGDALNPTFKPSAALFRGIGSPDDPDESYRQMALISPRHFICATHHAVSPSWQLRFIGNDGVVRSYAVAGTEPVLNAQGQTTDLMLGTLATEVDVEAGIEPFAVLNLATEAKYRTLPMLVFGKSGRAAKTRLQGFATLVNDPGFDTTRFAWFDFKRNDACNYESGDSGCPVFVMVRGTPALVGTNSGQDLLRDGTFRNYLNFIPAYIDRLDAMMASSGHRVRRVYPSR